MGDVAITRWTRYGKDRAYASAPDGEKLGFLDLATGEVTASPGVQLEELTASFAMWCQQSGVTPGPPAPMQTSTPPAAPVAPLLETATELAEPSTDTGVAVPEILVEALAATTWTDLASNLPGQAVRQQADATWQANKDRSKFLAFTARVLDVKTDERAWRVGAQGEEAVGARLEKLRENGWRVIHSIPVGTRGSDIDHVVIGPGGVFTINTKNHPGGKIWVAQYQMRVNGTPVPYLRNARFEAERAGQRLASAAGFDVLVRPCVVVLTGTLLPEVTYKQKPDDVFVLDRMDIPRWFKKRPAVLTPEQIEAIYSVARRSDTWV